MERNNLELTVGVFVLIGLLCLAYLSLKLGKIDLFGGKRYEVVADFDTASGLKPGASVEIAGVQVGSVEKMGLDPKQTGRARVYLLVDGDVKLQEDVIASIRSRGIIGDKFVLLQPGGSDTLLKPGARIRETESAVDL